MIFAAGLGTRLKPFTDTLPKALLPLGGHTLLEYQIGRLRDAGIREIVVNVHHFPDEIIQYLQENKGFGCRVQVSDEREMLLETGGGLRKAAKLLASEMHANVSSDDEVKACEKKTNVSSDDEVKACERMTCEEPVLVCNVDILSNIDLQDFISSYDDNTLGSVVVSQRETQRYLLFDKTNKLVGWTNVKTGECRPREFSEEEMASLNKLAFSGMQILSPRVFRLLDEFAQSAGDKFSMIDFYLWICEKESIMAYVPNDYKMMDVGKTEHLKEAEAFAEMLM